MLVGGQQAWNENYRGAERWRMAKKMNGKEEEVDRNSGMAWDMGAAASAYDA